jgi:hypothetical protein
MQPQAMPVSAGARCPPWSQPADAARLFLRGITVRPCVPVAAVVGCVLSAINEGVAVGTGRAGWLTWVQIGLNFVVQLRLSRRRPGPRAASAAVMARATVIPPVEP